MNKVEVLIERKFIDPSERCHAMQTYEDMTNYLRAEKAKWVLAYCNVEVDQTSGFSYRNIVHKIVWKFQIPNEKIRFRFNNIFGTRGCP